MTRPDPTATAVPGATVAAPQATLSAHVEQLKALVDILAEELKAAFDEPTPNRITNAAQLEREVRRLKQEVQQRKADLLELRQETARTLQRLGLENDHLRQELATAQRRLEEVTASRQRDSDFAPNKSTTVTEPPAASGTKTRQNADTLRPKPRAKDCP
jgi:hypothetical protein